MTKLTQAVETFFARYGKLSNDALQQPPVEDTGTIVQSFAPYFVGSSPNGVLGGANDEKFREMIPQGYDHYRAVGGKAMTITGIVVLELDEFHAMASVDWDFAYVRKDGTAGNIGFTNRYFVTVASGEPKIFAYITPDEEKAMSEAGLI